jgi:hypothetical protein
MRKFSDFFRKNALLLFQGAYVPLSQQFTPLSNANLSPALSSFFSSNDLPGLFNGLFKVAISVGAMLAVLRLAYAGYLYMGAGDMWGSKHKAKEVIGEAVTGLLLLLSIYIILYQINPCLLNLNVLSSLGGQAASCAQ